MKQSTLEKIKQIPLEFVADKIDKLEAELAEAKHTKERMIVEFGLESDAIYWEQRCNIVELQYIELKAEIAEADEADMEVRADVTKLENEAIRLEDEVDELKKKNLALMKLAGMYIKSYEELAFGGALKESWQLAAQASDIKIREDE